MRFIILIQKVSTARYDDYCPFGVFRIRAALIFKIEMTVGSFSEDIWFLKHRYKPMQVWFSHRQKACLSPYREYLGTKSHTLASTPISSFLVWISTSVAFILIHKVGIGLLDLDQISDYSYQWSGARKTKSGVPAVPSCRCQAMIG